MRTGLRQTTIACALGIALHVALPRQARAQATAGAQAAAQALFDEARKLMAENKFAEACPKFAESQKLDPGIGTQYNLATCYERAGQIASAWAAFVEVAEAAKLAHQPEREKVARERAAALEPKLSRLKIDVESPDAVSGLEVKRDGLVVGRGSWGVALPVDPGTHTITATAPGRKAWHTTVTIAPGASAGTTTVPALEEEPSAAPPPSPMTTPSPGPTAPEQPHPVAKARPLTAPIFLVGGVTLALGAATAITGIVALQKRSDFQAANGTPGHSQADLQDRHDQAATFATVSTALGGAALLGAVVTTVLIVTRPTRPAATAAARLRAPIRGNGWIDPHAGGGLVVTGSL